MFSPHSLTYQPQVHVVFQTTAMLAHDHTTYRLVLIPSPLNAFQVAPYDWTKSDLFVRPPAPPRCEDKRACEPLHQYCLCSSPPFSFLIKACASACKCCPLLTGGGRGGGLSINIAVGCYLAVMAWKTLCPGIATSCCSICWSRGGLFNWLGTTCVPALLQGRGMDTPVGKGLLASIVKKAPLSVGWRGLRFSRAGGCCHCLVPRTCVA